MHYKNVKTEKNKMKKMEIESYLKGWLKPLKLSKDTMELLQKPIIGSKTNLPSLCRLLKS